MQELAQYINRFIDFVAGANWVLPALGLLFVFLCIVSKGFRNFIIGLLVLSILVFEGLWFYHNFYSSEEERAELKKKVMEATGLEEKSAKDPTPTPTRTPSHPLRDRKF